MNTTKTFKELAEEAGRRWAEDHPIIVEPLKGALPFIVSSIEPRPDFSAPLRASNDYWMAMLFHVFENFSEGEDVNESC